MLKDLKDPEKLGKGLRVVKFYYNELFFDEDCNNRRAYDFAVLKL